MFILPIGTLPSFFSDKTVRARSQPTVSCLRRLQRSWRTRRKPPSRANQSLSRSSRTLVFGQYALPFFSREKVWLLRCVVGRSKTFRAMTRSRSIASLEMRSTSSSPFSIYIYVYYFLFSILLVGGRGFLILVFFIGSA